MFLFSVSLSQKYTQTDLGYQVYEEGYEKS